MEKGSSPSVPDQDRASPSGYRSVKRDKHTDQKPSRQDERIGMANPSPGVAISGISRDPSDRMLAFSGDTTVQSQHNPYPSLEQAVLYGGFANGGGSWDGYPQYFGSGDGMHVSTVMYNDNPSLLYHPAYGFSPDMAYGHYSPVATPMPPIMVEGQLYSPHQIPFSPSIYPQPAAQNMTSSVSLPSSELIGTESTNDGLLFGPGPGYLVHFGSYGGGNITGGPTGSNPLTTPSSFPQPMGILGPYENHVGQSVEYCYAPTSSVGHLQHGSFGGGPFSYPAPNDGMRFSFENGKRREGDQDSIYSSVCSSGFDRNRGPRASKTKGKIVQSSSSYGKGDSTNAVFLVDMYNRTDFCTDYKQAKFFIIKSFSEDNVHKSIKYNVWASTPHGNKKLDAAYHEAKEMGRNCPLFLFFSVNASGQFCGVAEMIGPVDFEKSADHWQQDRWSGQFPVQWHIIKDVPNSRFRHLVLENNDNKPVTHSRDSQEVNSIQGNEMLKIFKDHDAHTSILDDFHFYDTRERTLKERKVKQQSIPRFDQDFLPDINNLSDNVAQALRLDDSSRDYGTSTVLVVPRNTSLAPPNDQNAAVNKSMKSDVRVLHSADSSNHRGPLSLDFGVEDQSKTLGTESTGGCLN